jgi:YVTN family beta-propeller protein
LKSSSIVTTSLVYLSLTPGSVPSGENATIKNQTTGATVTTAVVNGGFDPVSIGAGVGDTLRIDVTTDSPEHVVHAALVVAARRAPRVVRTRPPSGGRDVPLNATIVVVFSAPIDAATVDTGSLQLLRESTAVVGSVGLADDAQLQAEFRPTGLLAPLTTYTFVVSRALRDLNGSTLDSTTHVSFTTVANPRPVVTRITPSTAVSGDPAFTLTVDGAGFLPTSVVNFAGANQVTTYVDSLRLTAAIPADAIVSSGTVPVTVTNPAPGGGVSDTVTFLISAAPPVAAKLAFTVQPTNSMAGTPLGSVTVAAQDTLGNTVTTYVGDVTIAIGTNPAGGTLSGQATVPAVGGVAVFPGLSIDKAASGYTLNATSGTLTPAASVPFDISVAPPRFSASPTTVVFGNQAIGTTSAPQTVTLTNNGSVPESFTIPINGYNWSDFAESSNCQSPLGAGASCTISITFTPAARGPRTGLLVLNVGDYQEVMVQFQAAGTGGLSVAVAPDPSTKAGKFVYVANSGSDNVSMYSINPGTGDLTPLVPPRIGAGSQPVSVAVDPSGRFAYVANFGSNDVSMFAIDSATGALTSIASPVPAGSGPVSVAVAADPSGLFGKFVYVVNAGSDDISMYTVDSTTGILTPIGSPVTAQSGPVSVAVHPSGKFAYVATESCPGVLNSCFGQYTINTTTGALSLTEQKSAGSTLATSIAVDPSGRFVVLTDGFVQFWMFAVNATTGALTGTDFTSTDHTPTAAAIDPSGRFAYVTTAGPVSPPRSFYGSSGVWMYSLDTNGRLTFMGTIGAGSYPTAIAIDPSGKFAYVASSGSQSVSIYSIAPDGTLTLIGTIGT